MSAAGTVVPDAPLARFLDEFGLVARSSPMTCTPLAGGVSSDIWLVETGGRQFCVKRALAQLRVTQEWTVPVERGIFEAAWLRGVAAFLPEAVPAVLAHDPVAGLLAMEFLPADRFALWKANLLAGEVDVAFAGSVGRRLAQIHAAFARDPEAPARFSSDAIFHSVRLEPYLVATAQAHPRHAEALLALCQRTASTKRTVVHGDISPKNILMGPNGPVFLDAECAWFGDPAFDAAFCLNHMLLKCIAVPDSTKALVASFETLAVAYCAGIAWEDPATLEGRIATLVPALLLARIDGKSPVEYIQDDAAKDAVRSIAGGMLDRPVDRLAGIGCHWADALGHHAGERSR